MTYADQIKNLADASYPPPGDAAGRMAHTKAFDRAATIAARADAEIESLRAQLAREQSARAKQKPHLHALEKARDGAREEAFELRKIVSGALRDDHNWRVRAQDFMRADGLRGREDTNAG